MDEENGGKKRRKSRFEMKVMKKMQDKETTKTAKKKHFHSGGIQALSTCPSHPSDPVAHADSQPA
jgi:hypothetical protein